MIKYICDECDENGQPCFLTFETNLTVPPLPKFCPMDGVDDCKWRVLKRVFLGGTCAGSTWREHLIPHLTVDYFNPVVIEWNDEAQAREIKEREECDILLYVLSNEMQGCYLLQRLLMILTRDLRSWSLQSMDGIGLNTNSNP